MTENALQEGRATSNKKGVIFINLAMLSRVIKIYRAIQESAKKVLREINFGIIFVFSWKN